MPPPVFDSEKVGTYSRRAKAGGGYAWDEVLEYRVWCSPHDGAPDEDNGSDYYFVFDSHDAARKYSAQQQGAEDPLALVLQREWIAEDEPGCFEHRTDERITEWPVEFLSRPRRGPGTLAAFFADDAPPNRLDIIRGL